MMLESLPCHTSNYRPANRAGAEYIVVHYTGNKGDTAANNASYFANHADLSASAHYFVDEHEVWQSVAVRHIAWHCGANTYRHPLCRNDNSIGVEICMWDKDGALRPGSILRAAALVRELMDHYGIPKEKVLRHFDVTGKHCPAPMVEDPARWDEFKALLDAKNSTRYERLADVPDHYGFRSVIGKLMDAGVIAGDGSDPTGNGDVIDLSYDMVRMLMYLYRAGVFDGALKQADLL